MLLYMSRRNMCDVFEAAFALHRFCVICIHVCTDQEKVTTYYHIDFFSADLFVTQYCSRILVLQCKMAAPYPGHYLLQSYTTSRSFNVCEYALEKSTAKFGLKVILQQSDEPKSWYLTENISYAYDDDLCHGPLGGPAESQRIITLTLIHSQLPFTQPPNPESARWQGSKLGKKHEEKDKTDLGAWQQGLRSNVRWQSTGQM